MELNSIADALSGLQSNQTYMDVVGNNISNVNTIAYKTQSVRFQDLMNQTLGLGSGANGVREGTNPFQVGMGVNTGSMVSINSQGAVQDTGRLTDMAIQGGGYFVVNNSQQNFYTRDGSFTVAPDGSLETATGMTVQGWGLNSTGTAVDTTTPLSAIKIPLGSQSATATTTASLAGNLDASQAVYAAGPPPTGGSFGTTMSVYDSQGIAHTLDLTFHKSAANTWTYTIAPPLTGETATVTSGGSGSLNFDASGKELSSSTTPPLVLNFNNSTSTGNVAIDFSKISQIAETSAVNVATVDGSPGGTISTFSVGNNGTLTAVYSNGSSKTIGQIGLADFRNPDGLIRQGNNLYTLGVNSGNPQVGTAGVGTLGTLSTGQLEGSNVDLATQFAQMIQAQQGFNANTKVITTTNNMLQAVISIVP